MTREQDADRQRRANLRLALMLATLAATFALGFFAKIAFLGPN